MRIAGIYPQKVSLDPKIQHAVSEPYGLQKILAIAQEDFHDVELFVPIKRSGKQFTSMTEAEFVSAIVKFKPDIACFSMYTCQFPFGERIAKKIKEKLPNLINIGGNRYPTFLKDKIQAPFDFFVVGEGEITFRKLLQEIETTKNYDKIKGLAFLKNGKGYYNGHRPRMQNLDCIPDATRHNIILKQAYKGISIPPISEEPHYAIMEYSRGCYGVCKFCDNKHVWGNTVSFRSAQRVVDEMFKLQKLGVKIFYFMDLNFTAVPKRVYDLCDEIGARGLKADWYCMSNIATASEDLLKVMKKAGCYKIAWGIESTNNSSLKKMDKRIGNHLLKQTHAISVLKKAQDIGFINQGYYIIGFPWENSKSIIQGGYKIQDLPLHQLNVGIFTPIPLSDFHGDIKSSDLNPNLEKHDRNTFIYNHDTMNNTGIKKIQEQMHKDFYANKTYLKNVRDLIKVDSRFLDAFQEYFDFLGAEVKL